MDPNTPAQNQNTIPPSPLSEVPQVDVPIDIPPPGGLPLKKILIIGGTILGIIAIIIVTFVFIVPRFIDGTGVDENVELVYWGVWNDDEVFQEVITEFEKENPNIKVKYEKQDVTKLNDYVPRVQTRIDEGTGPDLYRFHNSMTPQLVSGSGQYLLPLPDDVVKDTGLAQEYYPVIREDMNIGGAYYGIPLYIDTLSLFVNEDIFQDTGYEYPTEWGYFLDLARNLTIVQGEGGERKIVRPGAALGTYDNVEHADDIVSLLMVQSGLDKENFVDGSQTNEINGVMEYYTCFATENSSCEPVWDETQQNSKLAFATGQLPMYFGYTYDLFEILAINQNLNITILPVPRLGEDSSTVASYWAEGISGKTEHPDEAYKFLKFLADRENMQVAFANQTKLYGIGSAYPREDMAEILSGNKYLAPVVKQAPNAKPFVFYSNTFDGAKNNTLSEALAGAVGSIISGEASIDSASEALTQKVAQTLGITQPTGNEEQ